MPEITMQEITNVLRDVETCALYDANARTMLVNVPNNIIAWYRSYVNRVGLRHMPRQA